jgi:hypothetical protein
LGERGILGIAVAVDRISFDTMMLTTAGFTSSITSAKLREPCQPSAKLGSGATPAASSSAELALNNDIASTKADRTPAAAQMP